MTDARVTMILYFIIDIAYAMSAVRRRSNAVG
jgi:hypothetical protein